jgi:hypothetical protein
MGQWYLAVVVIKVGVLASGGEREGLLKSLDAQHGGIMERTQCYRQESNATRIGTETFDRTYAPEVLWYGGLDETCRRQISRIIPLFVGEGAERGEVGRPPCLSVSH